MLECWNVGMLVIESTLLLSEYSHFFVKGNVVSIPLSHFPRTHYSIIPVVHYSNCERSELSSVSKMPEIFEWSGKGAFGIQP